LAICIDRIDPIAHQAASRRKFAKMVHRWYSVARRQGHNRVAACVEERTGRYRKRTDAIVSNNFECHLDLTIGVGPQDMNMQANGTRRLLHVF
jgi:hypothetical protein